MSNSKASVKLSDICYVIIYSIFKISIICDHLTILWTKSNIIVQQHLNNYIKQYSEKLANNNSKKILFLTFLKFKFDYLQTFGKGFDKDSLFELGC